MPASLIRTASGGSFTADITPSDVVDRCARCRLTFREGDLFCEHLATQHGHAIARVHSPLSAAVTASSAPLALNPVFLAPEP